MDDILVSPVEFKFAADPATGEFSGYASVFNNQDSHGDLILPGAFTATLAERKAQGRGIPMHVMHGVFGGDGVPVGVWKNVQEDDKGLLAEGKISGMNTDAGRLLYERVKDGALGGLSIGYRVKANGSTLGQKAGEPKRTIKAVHLGEISLVDDPSNALARVHEVKAAASVGDHTADSTKAASSLAAAIQMHDAYMGDRTYPSAKDKALLMSHMMDAHEALTGNRVPNGVSGWKGIPVSLEELTRFFAGKGLSPEQAAQLAESGFKSMLRAGGDGGAPPVVASGAAAEFSSMLSDFRLPTFG